MPALHSRPRPLAVPNNLFTFAQFTCLGNAILKQAVCEHDWLGRKILG
jgi:hypothetical protein